MGLKGKIRKWKEQRAYHQAETSKARTAATKAYYQEHAVARVKAAKQRARIEQEHKITVLKKQLAAKSGGGGRTASFQESARNISQRAGAYQGGGLMGVFSGPAPAPGRAPARSRKRRKKKRVSRKGKKRRASRPQDMVISFR